MFPGREVIASCDGLASEKRQNLNDIFKDKFTESGKTPLEWTNVKDDYHLVCFKRQEEFWRLVRAV